MKRITAFVLAMVMCVCVTACSGNSSEGTTAELKMILDDIAMIPIGTPGVAQESTVYAAALLDWCQMTTLKSEDIAKEVDAYYDALKNDVEREQFYEQLVFVCGIAQQLKDDKTRDERLETVGLKPSEHIWDGKAFSPAASFVNMVEAVSPERLKAVVLSVHDKTLMVTPLDQDGTVSDLISVHTDSALDGITDGVTVLIAYGGEILTSYPPQIRADSVAITAYDYEVVNAEILEITEASVLVRPLEGEDELKSADKIYVSGASVPEGAAVGAKMAIVYNGEIAESYPAQITGAAAMVLLNVYHE